MDPRLLKIEIRWFDRQIILRSFLSCVCAFYPRSATYPTMISDVYVCRVLHFIVSAGWWTDLASDVYWYVCNVIYLVTMWTAHHWPSQLPPNLLSIFPHASVCHVAGKMDIGAAEINNTWHENYSTYCPLYSLSVCLLMYPSIDCRK